MSSLLRDVEYEANAAAFRSIQKKFLTPADLESLQQKKQLVSAKYTEKLSLLKTRVQTIVSDCEGGLVELNQLSETLLGLLEEMKQIEKLCQDPTGKFTHYAEMQKLGKILERLYIVTNLQKRFDEVVEEIKQIEKFMDENKEIISITCYNHVVELLDFESFLLNKVKTSTEKDTVTKMFETMHNVCHLIVSNSHDCINTAFTPDVQTTTNDLSKAIWIALCEFERKGVPNPIEVLKTSFTGSITQQFKIADDLSLDAIDAVLKNLMSALENITDKLDIIIPALPPKSADKDGIDIMEILEQIANEEVLKLIHRIVESTKKTTYLYSHIILWLRDYTGSMVHMLAVQPSEALIDTIKDYEFILVGQIPHDMGYFLRNIIEMDARAVESSRDGRVSTRAPADFLRYFNESHEIARKSKLDHLLPDIEEQLLVCFAQTLDEFTSVISNTYSREYACACINNSLDGTKSIDELAQDKRLNGIVDDYQKGLLKSKWGAIQKAAIKRLIELIIEKAAAEDGYNFRIDFPAKLECIKDCLAEAQRMLLPPLFRKFQNAIVRQVLAYYIACSQVPMPDVTFEHYAQSARDDMGIFRDWVSSISSRVAKEFDTPITGTTELLSEPKEDIGPILIYGNITEIFKDFTPKLMYNILAARPDKLKVSNSDHQKKIEDHYKTLVCTEDDNFISSISSRFKRKKESGIPLSLDRKGSQSAFGASIQNFFN